MLESYAIVEDHRGKGSGGAEDDGHAVTVEASGDELIIFRIGGVRGVE